MTCIHSLIQQIMYNVIIILMLMQMHQLQEHNIIARINYIHVHTWLSGSRMAAEDITVYMYVPL